MLIDLNADLGESFGSYTLGADTSLLPLLSSANLACGFHAGDPVVMEEAVERALSAGVAIGAHPGYPDLVGFGRRNMSLSAREARCAVEYQLGALMAFASAHGARLQHVKLHGAFYNQSAANPELARAVCKGVRAVDDRLIFLGLAGSCHAEAAHAAGLRFASEVFADRGYREDGSLVPRGQPGALLEDADEAAARVVRMLREGRVQTLTGRDIPIRADSICVHGDNPKALAFATKLRLTLTNAGITIAPLSKVLP